MKTNKSRGLGDDIYKITSAVRLDELAKKIAEIVGTEDCGCDERRETLNRIFPRKQKGNNE
jgi:hypothetical protein